MALWDKPNPPKGSEGSSATTTTTAATPTPSVQAAQPAPVSAPPSHELSSKAAVKERTEMKESLIASGLTIEGKINGKGHVRVAGKFKGDIHVDGDLHIDTDAKVEGLVKAGDVIVNGELQGNIDGAKHVELKQGGTINGDLKAGSLTVAAGARMRGNVEFGFDTSTAKSGNVAERSRESSVA